MKNVYMTVLLCATGLVATNGSFAATATEEQWSQSVTLYPNRRPGFNFEVTNVPNKVGTQNIDKNIFVTEMLSFDDDYGVRRALACNKIPTIYDYLDVATVCNSKDYVAIGGLAQTGKYKALAFVLGALEKKNHVWRCGAEGVFEGVDEWLPKKKIDACRSDVYQVLKDKPNTISYLFDATVSRTTLYQAIVNPSEHVCVTYACAPDHVPTLNIEKAQITSANSSQLECISTVKACEYYVGNKKWRAYPKVHKTALCNSKTYWIGPTQDMTLQDATHGTLYIDELIKHMNAQLAANITVARNLYNKRPNNGVFTCNDLGCELTDNVLPAENTNCEYLCTSEGFAVRLDQKAPNGPCPMYFKQQYDTTKEMYVCNFDADAANGKITDAVAQQRAGCAKSFCEVSGGVYNNDNGNCTCNGEPCNDSYNEYFYCKPTGIKYCEGGVWKDWGAVVPTTDERTALVNGWTDILDGCIADANKEYNSSINASSITAAGEDISTLAGRLAAIEGQFGLSKWRTADGKFNTARLASDLTAGVVLGTTGALVTSSVVKKKQVKDGFESLECRVGGQHVGDWGDVFRIDGK